MAKLSLKKIDETKKRLNSARDPRERRIILMDVIGLSPFIAERKTMQAGSLPIHMEIYENATDRPVIVFLPGIGTYSEMYCEFLYKLSTWGFNVVGVDIRGHGYSGGDRGVYTVEQVISDMKTVVDVLSLKFEGPIGFFGCSIGAPLAMACAENDSRIKALLCHTLFLSEYPPDVFTSFGWNSLRMSRLFMPNFKIDFRSFIDVDALISGNAFADFIDYDDRIVWEYTIDTLADIYSWKTTLLEEKKNFNAAIITGEFDEVIQVNYMKTIIEKMKHPFDFICIPRARHMLPFLNVRETVLAARDWFGKNLL
jgi:alpha-beta hydrolase superfamily lysophospholipase